MSVEMETGKRSIDYRIQRGASGLGISFEVYRHHVEAGMKWCCGHKKFEPRTAFGVRNSKLDGLMNVCRAFETERVKAYQARKRKAAQS